MQETQKQRKQFKGTVTSFRKGLNKSIPPSDIDPEELVDATNHFYDPKTGFLTTRPGLKLLKAKSVPEGFTGIYPFISNQQLYRLATCEDQHLYLLDENYEKTDLGVLTGSARTSFATMAGKAAIASGGYLQTYEPIAGLSIPEPKSPPMSFIIGKSTNVAAQVYARIWGFGDPAFPWRVVASGSNDPTMWDFNNKTEDGPKYLDAGQGDGEDVVGIIPYMGYLFIPKRAKYGNAKSVYQASIGGLVANWDCQPISGFHGGMSPHMMVELNNRGFIIDSDGPKSLSVVLNYPSSIPFDVQESGLAVAGEIASFSDSTGFSIHDPLFQLLMIKPKVNSDIFYCYDYRFDRWTYFKYAVDIRAGALVNGQMLLGDADGNLYTYDPLSDQDNGQDYDKTVESKWFDLLAMDEQELKERFFDVLGITDGTLTVMYKSEGEDKYPKTFSFGASWEGWDKVNSIMPSAWTEKLNKAIMKTCRDDNAIGGDYIGFKIIVNSGLCALARIRLRAAATGKK